jgi:hypothetical protein
MYTLILGIFIVIIIIVVIVWSAVVKTEPEAIVMPPLLEAGFNQRCAGNTGLQCAEGMVCTTVDPNVPWGFCKVAIGRRCNALSECESSARSCYGVCSISVNGELNQPCPCGVGLVCTNTESIFGRCKVNLGDSGCRVSSDCISGGCVDGRCVPRVENGKPCTISDACYSGNCSKGWCQPQGESTGEIGATCRYYQNDPRCVSSACFVDFKEIESLENKRNGTLSQRNIRDTTLYQRDKRSTIFSNIYGVCAPQLPEWNTQSCSRYAACVSPTVCFGGRCLMPRTNSTLLTNSCDTHVSSGVCSQGYRCTSDDVCIATSTNVPTIGLVGVGDPVVLFKWDNTGIRWIRYSIPFVSQRYHITGLTLASEDIFLLSTPNESRIITSNENIPLNIVGPYNGTVLLSNTQHLQFQVERLQFTYSGGIAILFSWLQRNPGQQFRRVYYINIFNDIYEGYTYRYQVRWDGMIPNTNIAPGSPQAVNGDFHFMHTSTTINADINSFDVDDRTNNIKVLVTTRNIGVWYTLITNFNDLGTLRFQTKPTNTGGISNPGWARFYSHPETDNFPDTFVYGFRTEFKASVPGSGSIDLNLGTEGVHFSWFDQRSMYSSLRGGLSGTQFAFISTSETGGRFQMHNHMGADFILPGYFNAATSTVLTYPAFNVRENFIPNLYILGPA